MPLKVTAREAQLDHQGIDPTTDEKWYSASCILSSDRRRRKELQESAQEAEGPLLLAGWSQLIHLSQESFWQQSHEEFKRFYD